MHSPGISACACSLVGAALFSSCLTGSAQPVNRLQPHVAESKLYALHKPAGWKVTEESRKDSFRILVNSVDGVSTVDFFWAHNEQGKPDALWFLAAYRRLLSQKYPDVSFSEAYVSRDSSRALATVRYRSGKVPIKGRYYFESKPNGHSAQGYTAPEALLNSQRPLLLNVMASLAFSKAQPRAASTGQPAPSAQPIAHAPLVPRQAPDGSLTLRIPSDWTFLAGGGKVIAGAPDGGMGFIFTSISGNPLVPGASIAQGILAVPYQPPPQALTLILQAFRHRNVRILSAAPDTTTLRECMSAGRRCDAQDLVARWTSSGGADSLGAIKMINSPPSITGIWYCIMSGIWGPEKEFYRYHPLLEQVGASFSINDQYARRYIQSGLENLRRLQRQTAAAMQDLNRAREQNQADWEARQARKDYMDSKWDDYRRGNSYWVSELEGGKVYHTDNWGTRDTTTGDYYEGRSYNWVDFEGQNPRFPSENMREVSSYEVEHGGRPPR
jgi:hypothetical protein